VHASDANANLMPPAWYHESPSKVTVGSIDRSLRAQDFVSSRFEKESVSDVGLRVCTLLLISEVLLVVLTTTTF
jgi:hypothetical protein